MPFIKRDMAYILISRYFQSIFLFPLISDICKTPFITLIFKFKYNISFNYYNDICKERILFDFLVNNQYYVYTLIV